MLAQTWQDKGCGQEMLNNPEFTINIPPRQPLGSKDCAGLSPPGGLGWEKESRAQMAFPWASPLPLHLRFREIVAFHKSLQSLKAP